MTESKLEEIVKELIVNGGGARGKALEAVKAARKNEMEKADVLLKECNQILIKAHNYQTSLIQRTMNGEEEGEVSLLMVHAQDHLMDALVVKDLAVEMVEMYRLIYTK